MKKGLEELRNISPETVMTKTHIVQSVLDDIIQKRFDRLNPIKAKGFIRIIEREFDLDLSDWLRELDAHSGVAPTVVVGNSDMTAIDLSVQEERTKTKPIAAILLTLIALGGGTYFYFASDISKSAENNESNLSAIVDLNANSNNSIVVPSDINADMVSEANLTETAEQLSLSAQQEKAADANATKKSQATLPFYCTTNKKLWIGIRYLDNNQSMEKTVSERIEFDSGRPQLITFGHGLVKLTIGDSEINPLTENTVRYLYKNKKLKFIDKAEHNRLAGIKE